MIDNRRPCSDPLSNYKYEPIPADEAYNILQTTNKELVVENEKLDHQVKCLERVIVNLNIMLYE